MTELTWLGHATVTMDIGGVRIVTDPLLRRWTTGLVRVGSLPERSHWHGADVVLLSHLHHDHADVASLRRLRSARVASGTRNTRWARRRGLAAQELADSGWHHVARSPRSRHPGPEGDPADGAGGSLDREPDDGVEIHLVRADHGDRPMPHRPNDAHGFLLRSSTSVVWFAGDTSLHEDMERLPEIAGRSIDVALVPIGGWGPRLSGGHMGPAEAAEACRRVGARHAVPIHYGTLHPSLWPPSRLAWMGAPLELFREEIAERSPVTRLHALGQGQTLSLAAA